MQPVRLLLLSLSFSLRSKGLIILVGVAPSTGSVVWLFCSIAVTVKFHTPEAGIPSSTWVPLDSLALLLRILLASGSACLIIPGARPLFWFSDLFFHQHSSTSQSLVRSWRDSSQPQPTASSWSRKVSFTTEKMLHTRSVSDPPLSPTTLGPMESFASLSRPTTPSPAAPHNAQAYVNRALPPLPPPTFNPGAIPQPLNIRKSKPPTLPLGPSAPSRPVSNEAPPSRREARSVSPLPTPSTPVKASNPLHLSTISSNNSSPAHTLKPRKSKKVLQLMGHDIDVMNLVGVAPPEPKREPPLRSSRSIEGAPNLNATTLLHLPEESLIPVLEDDDGRDSMSSKKSSWGPGSPHSASRISLGPKHSVRRRRSARIFDQDDTGHLATQEPLMSNLDLNDDEELLSEEDMTMEEYHKFASELAHSSARKPSHEESRPTTATQGRRSSILSFTHSRLRRKPTTSESRHGRLGSSSSAEHASQAPAPAAPEAEGAVPKSGWDSDSESEEDRTSRSIWPRGRSSNKGRDSPASMTRHDDDARGSRGWAKGGLLNVGKRRKDPQTSRDFGGVDEKSFA